MIEKYLNGEVAANRKWLEDRMLKADFINRVNLPTQVNRIR
jgi:hypothetical protein